MFCQIFNGYSLQDGYVDLTTANFDRLNQDVIEDLNRLMKMELGREKLDYDRFVDLMLETEVKSLTIILCNLQELVGTLVPLWSLSTSVRETWGFEPRAK